MQKILVLDGSATGEGAASLIACVDADAGQEVVVAQRHIEGRGGAEELAPLTAEVLRSAGWHAPEIDVVAVVVGPGSFTGLRASVALAHGLAMGADAQVVGVTIGEALWPALQDQAAVLGCTDILCMNVARKGRIFVERDAGDVRAEMTADFAPPAGLVLFAGTAAAEVAAGIGSHQIMVSDMKSPDARQIARAALARQAGKLAVRDPLPLYVDPPEAKLPAAGLRPAPR